MDLYVLKNLASLMHAFSLCDVSRYMVSISGLLKVLEKYSYFKKGEYWRCKDPVDILNKLQVQQDLLQQVCMWNDRDVAEMKTWKLDW